MTISIPSREIYAVDIPEVKDLAAKFQYNFFVPDEATNDTGGVPVAALTRNASEIDASFIQYSTTRAPRFITLNFTPIRLADDGRMVTDLDVRNNVFELPSGGSLITDNLDKIVTEDQFASYDFIGVQFQDSAIDDKVFALVSGSFEQLSTSDAGEMDTDASLLKAANSVQSVVGDYVSAQFLSQASAQSDKATGTSFHIDDAANGSSSTQYKNIKNQVNPAGRGKAKTSNKFYQRLKAFHIHSQINTKLLRDVIRRTINDPNSPFTDDLQPLYQFSAQALAASSQQYSLQVNENDYKTIVQYINLQVKRLAQHTGRNPVKIVGYMIDKIELTRTGETIQHPSIILEGSQLSFTADFRVKYDSTYTYAVRTIAQFMLPGIDDDTGDVATLTVLVSSRPSNKIQIHAVEQVAPPPPTDLNFTWNYEQNQLLVHWTFPPNSQRDIKKFQVFRRKSIEHPFELIKMYDFNDSTVRFNDFEHPNPALIEYLTSPCSFYVDDDFTKNSTYIYAVAAVDAHGMTSNYSSQYEIGFDIFKNKLTKRLVSHTGAPKPYPNLYLEADTFVESIRVNGPNSKKLKVVFNPEYYYVYDDDQKITKVVGTKQDNCEYRLQLINLDNQKSQDLTITIDDQIRLEDLELAPPTVAFGKVKKQKTQG